MIGLEAIQQTAHQLIDNQVAGRILIDVNA